jgi:hypothetical protein
MKKIKIQLNRPEPSSSEIKGMQNFAAVLSGVVVSKPWYTKSIWKVVGGLNALVILVGVVFYFTQHSKDVSGEESKNTSVLIREEKSVTPQNQTKQEPTQLTGKNSEMEEKIGTPGDLLSETLEVENVSEISYKSSKTSKQAKAFISDVTIYKPKAKFEKFRFRAEEGGEIITKHKSFLRFASNSFRKKSGEVANGEIQIMTREFHDALDIAVASITMAYDSSGQHHHLQSAGMIEVYALQGKDTLDLIPGKGYEINLVSNTADPSYNLYYLNAKNNRWNHIGKDLVLPSQGNSDVKSVSLGNVNNKEENLPPVIPQKKNNKRYRFDIDVDKREFPELVEFNGLFFEVDAADTNFTRAFYKMQWNNVEIIGQADNRSYVFRFSKTIKLLEKFPEIEYDKELYNSDKAYYRMINGRRGNTISSTFNAFPVFDGADSAKVWKWYNDKLKTYNKKVAERQRAEEESRAMSQEQQRMQFEREKKLAPQLATNNLVYRSFLAMNMGVYNCDQIYRMAKRTTRPMFFKSKTGMLNSSNIKLVDKTANSVMGFYDHNITYNPDNDNMIVIILNDGRIAYVAPSEIRKLKSTPKENTVETVIPETQFADTDAMKKFLEQLN